MAITAVLASTIGFIGMSFILKNSQKYFIAKQKELGNLNGHIEEIYSGLSIVKVYNGTEMSSKQLKNIIKVKMAFTILLVLIWNQKYVKNLNFMIIKQN